MQSMESAFRLQTEAAGIFDIRKDTVYYVDASSLKDIRKKPEYLAEYGSTGYYPKDREICYHQAVMHPTENKALVAAAVFAAAILLAEMA